MSGGGQLVQAAASSPGEVARERAVTVLTDALVDAGVDFARLRFGDPRFRGSCRTAALLAVDELLERPELVRVLAGLTRPATPVTTAGHVVVPREVLMRWARELAALERVADRAVGRVLRGVAGRVAVYAVRREGS